MSIIMITTGGTIATSTDSGGVRLRPAQARVLPMAALAGSAVEDVIACWG